MNKTIGKIKGILKKRLALFFFCAAAVLMLLSVLISPQGTSLDGTAARVERELNKRQQLLESFANKALETPVNSWLSFENFPQDMVIYRYNADTLQSWVNQFPINNDEVDIDAVTYSQMYRLHYFDSRSQYNSPFTYLTADEQYVNIGSAWYVVKVYAKESQKIIAGLLVKSEVGSENESSSAFFNPYLKLGKRMDIVPVNYDVGAVVSGKGGEVLFSVIEDIAVKGSKNVSLLSWLALALALCGLFAFLNYKRNYRRFFIYFIGITVLRILCFQFAGYVRLDSDLFSPALYADKGIFSSLGNLLLNNLYVTALCIGFFMLRKINIDFVRARRGVLRRAVSFLLLLLPVILFAYIHFTLCSLVKNSSIILEIYRITDLSIYSLLCYLSYSLLFLVLLFSIQVAARAIGIKRKHSLLTVRNILVFVFFIALYSLATISSLSFKKECEWSKVLSNKLSIERDLGLELELKSIELKLSRDPLSAILINLPKENQKALEQRFAELYFQDIRQKYIINFTICRANDLLPVSQLVIDCGQYFEALLLQYDAVPISDGSSFFYLSNFNGKVAYMGVFKYLTINGPVTLYLEINSRYSEELSGYPTDLLNYRQSDNLNVPANYSYAKYFRDRITVYRGIYNYPVSASKFKSKEAFSVRKMDNLVHFINKVSDDNMVVVSRQKRTFFPYLVSFSYLMLFYCAIFFSILRIRRAGKRAVSRLKAPKKSIRRKMTYLLTTSLVVSLIAMGMGSVWFSIQYYNGSNLIQMQEKIRTVQKTFAEYCTYAQSYTEINSSDLYQAMDRLANDTQADINLFDPHGKLIRSTKSELFDRYILSSRMNAKAYSELVLKTRNQVFNKERIGNYRYYSLYASIYNYAGKLIAVANIPYFTKTTSLRGDISTVVATIINIYILLLIAAIFLGSVLSNSVSKPLAQLSGKLRDMDVSQKPEHINYKGNDELGALVQSYNKMVDSLAESTKQMAQTERERAWSEMARRIAHEIKNPLTPMKLSIQRVIMLKRKNAPGWQDKLEDISNSMLEQIDILSNTASEFSSFAKFFVEENTVFNLYEVIREQTILFDTQDNIRISFGHDSENCPVYARKGQIIRVIVNLVSNAIQALEKVSETGKGFVRLSLTLSGNDYVVAIEDNGDGVKEEDVTKLFTPNFTTKTSGNGLGLAISKSIVDQSGGRIWYSRSELGGATFAFSLPRFKES